MKNKLYIISGPNGSGKTTLAHELVARGNSAILDILDDKLYNKFKKESK